MTGWAIGRIIRGIRKPLLTADGVSIWIPTGPRRDPYVSFTASSGISHVKWSNDDGTQSSGCDEISSKASSLPRKYCFTRNLPWRSRWPISRLFRRLLGGHVSPWVQATRRNNDYHTVAVEVLEADLEDYLFRPTRIHERGQIVLLTPSAVVGQTRGVSTTASLQQRLHNRRHQQTDGRVRYHTGSR